MHHFRTEGGLMLCEDVPLADIAQAVGTPAYVYSSATLERHVRVFREAVGQDALVAFAVKANPNLAVLSTIARMGAGADTVSAGEIRRALAAGIPPGRILFAGVGKTRDELDFAVTTGVHQINVESPPELEALDAVARARGLRQDIAIRVNPGIGAGGHDKISTGGAESKFGVGLDEARAIYARAHALQGVRPMGIACHIGSQITDLGPLRRAFETLVDLVRGLRAQGLSVARLDLGGGLGVPYQDEMALPGPAEYGAMVQEVTRGLGVQLAFEPGRLIAGNAGILMARVIHVHARVDRRFLVLDAAMNDLLRPALYDAFHDIVPVRAPSTAARLPHDVVGPVCETGDTFARDRLLPPMEAGDLVAFMTAGAYGATMGSTYNSRALVPEVLVRGDRFEVVRRRVDVEEMMALERLPAWLSPTPEPLGADLAG
jgi:diaminopimelate decarboxylase